MDDRPASISRAPKLPGWLRPLIFARIAAVHLGAVDAQDELVQVMPTMTGWLFRDPPDLAVITTRSIVQGGLLIAHVFHDADDGGWQFHDGEPGPPSEEDAMVVSLRSVVERDPTLNDLADLPEGWRAWRDGPTAPWKRSGIG